MISCAAHDTLENKRLILITGCLLRSPPVPAEGFLLGCVFWAPHPINGVSWEISVAKYGGEVEALCSSRVTHVLCETQRFPEFQQCIREGKRLITVDWLNDVCIRKCVMAPFYAIHLPVPFHR